MNRLNLIAVKRRYLTLLILPAFLFAGLFAGWQTADMQAKVTLADLLTGLRSKKVTLTQRNKLLTTAVLQRGVTFVLSAQIEEELRGEGANDVLIAAIRQKGGRAVSTPTPVYRPTPAQTNNGSAESYSKQGDDYYNNDDYARAFDSYNRAIQADSQQAIYYVKRGLVYYFQGYTGKAYDDFRAGVKLSPGVGDESFMKCLLYDTATGNANRAVNECTAAIKELPKLSLLYYKRGNAYDVKNDYANAFSDFSKVVEGSPKSIIGYLGRGAMYVNYLKDYDRAIADSTAAIRIDPQTSAAYFNRGLAYYNKGDNDRAIADYTMAIRNNPSDASAYNNRGVAYQAQENFRAAAADYRKAIQLDPDYQTAKNNLKILEDKNY